MQISWEQVCVNISNVISRPIHMYFKWWLIRTNLYNLTQIILYGFFRVLGLGVDIRMHSYKFVKYVLFFTKPTSLYEPGCTNPYELATS